MLFTFAPTAVAQEGAEAVAGFAGVAGHQEGQKDGLAQASGPTVGLMHYPVVSRTHVAFVYGDQIWTAPRIGGAAVKLTDAPGAKYRLAFSTDGRTIAFSANLDGNSNLYTIPLEGGKTTRVTHLPSNVNLCQWAAHDQLLFYTNSLSFSTLAMQLFTVHATGGLPVKLPVPYGSESALSIDGEWLAYTPYWPYTNLRQMRKRYTGGIAPDIWLFNLRTRASKKITDWPGTDTSPMWFGKTVYYLSDAGSEHRLNVWSYNITSGTRQQITAFNDYDLNHPSFGLGAQGTGEIIFQYGSEIQLLDIATGQTRPIEITLPTDATSPMPREVDASKFITNSELSPNGNEVLLGARGDVWVLLSGGSGMPKNITRTSGAFERDPALSQDGGHIAYFSDATGEYELYVARSDGAGEAQRLTTLGRGFRYAPQWSPDSGKIAFTDVAGGIFLTTLATREAKRIDTDAWSQQSQLAWSHDSTWLAYTKLGDNRLSSIWLYNTASGERRQVSGGIFNDGSPAFDHRGDYLFFVSNRNLTSPALDPLNRTFAYTDTSAIVAVPLRDEVASPLLPQHERVTGGRDARESNSSPPKPLAIELESLGRRAVVLPTRRANIFNLGVTADGNLIYAETITGGESSIRIFDPSSEKAEERVVLEGATDFQLAASGRKALVRKMGALLVIDAAPGQKTPAQVSTAGMSVTVDPRAEWRQIFDDTWRLFRDFFYAPNMHGVNWSLLRERYGRLLDHAVTRDDVNYVISEMIAELNTGHAWISNPGDVLRQSGGPSAMLGADFRVENNAYRINKLYEGASWDDAARNPLARAGVKEGDYLLAVNGAPLDIGKDPLAALQKTANTPVKLTVGVKPVMDASARVIVVKPLANDSDLRYRAWVEHNRALVEQRTNGQVGYLRISDFTFNGLSEFVRQFQGQINKKALIIDPRWSQGGSVGDILVRMLAQPPLNYYGVRDSVNNWPVPARAHQGPKCVLINHLVVSAGENFSYYFRKLGLGKLIGTRTWGGLVGLNGNPALIDGGYVNIPNAPFFSNDGEWLIENQGIEPDVEVLDDPSLMADGHDPQLEAAIRLMLEEIRRKPKPQPRRPPYPNRSTMNNRQQFRNPAP
ncbi:MAG TPA: S41 family peptidase [Pyrinomonadaceae bacterium]|nr:S41 family peptidase [Pyrinomonadaceae bacterium]